MDQDDNNALKITYQEMFYKPDIRGEISYSRSVLKSCHTALFQLKLLTLLQCSRLLMQNYSTYCGLKFFSLLQTVSTYCGLKISVKLFVVVQLNLQLEKSISGWAVMNCLRVSCFFCSSLVGLPISCNAAIKLYIFYSILLSFPYI